MTRTAVESDGHEHHEHDDEGYRGPATLTIDGVDHAVGVRLTGHFQPIDGWFHWYGRADVDPALEATLGGRKRPVRVVTPAGAADGEIADPDPWGRYRITGTSTPPFAVAGDDTDGGDTEREV